jgi:Trypsin
VKRLLALMCTGALVALGTVAGAGAITNGTPDQNNHPYVGLMVAQAADGNPLWRCSGTLLSPTVFLTAAHCTEAPAAHVEIWFDSGYPNQIPLGAGYPAAGANRCAGITGYPCTGDVGGTPYANPDYNVNNPYGGGNGLPAFAYRDVGVVQLDTPFPMATFGELPDAGKVDTLKNKTAIDFVGYGVQEQVMLYPGESPSDRWTGPRTRMYAPSQLVSGNFVHSAEFMRLTLNPGGGKGGTCFGDSGGPDLLGGTNIVLAVNSYVTNSNCSGVGYSQRVDIEEVLDWINSF